MATPSAYLPLLRMSTAVSGMTNESAAAAGAAATPTPTTAEAAVDLSKPMDPERAAWLKEALAASVVDPVAEMKKVVADATKADAKAEERAAALERLVGFVENIDLARDLHKIGGLKPVVELVSKGETPDVRANAAMVLGSAVQNNPEPQSWALELGALAALKELLSRPDVTPKERAKGLFALSSVVRHHDLATIEFLTKHAGFALLAQSLDDGGHEDFLAARRKALFLMLYLVTRVPKAVPASSRVVVPLVVKALRRDAHDADVREKALQVLAVYGESDAVRGSHTHEVHAVLVETHHLVKKSGGEKDELDVVRTTAVAWRVPVEMFR